MSDSKPFKILEFKVVPSKNQVISNEETTQVTPKMMAVISRLAQSPKETVSKDELLNDVWGDVAVSELVLSRAIADLRKVFGEAAKNAQIIQTVSKKGYCLNQTPEFVESELVSYSQVGTNKSWSTRQIIAFTLGIVLIGIISIIYLSLPSGFRKHSYQSSHLTTDDEKSEYQPRFSNNGKLLAYVEVSKELHSSLNIYSLGSKSKTTLFSLEGLIRSPVFSPDNEQIAYYESTLKNCSLVIKQISPQQEIKRVPCNPSSSRSLDWSPDGKYLLTNATNTTNRSEELIQINVDNLKSEILMPLNKKQVGLLFSRYSPNGKVIATLYFEPSGNRWSVTTFDLESKALTHHWSENNFLNQVVWADASTLLFAVASGDNAGIWSLDINSGERALVISTDPVDMDFDRLSQSFAVIEEKRDIDIWQYNTQENYHKKISASSKTERLPAVSPQGDRLAFLSNSSNHFNVWVKSLQDGQLQQLTQFEKGMINDLRWHPNGEALYFTYVHQGHNQIQSIDLNRNIRSLLDPQGNHRFLDWSPDGKKIYYLSENDEKKWHLYEYDTESSMSEMLINSAINRLKATNSSLYFQEYVGATLFQLDLNSKKKIKKRMDELPATLSWDLAENGLYLLSITGRAKADLLRLNEATGELQNLTQIPLSTTISNKSISVSQDGKTVYYANLEHSQRDLLLYQPMSK